jgi:hypothetical protein
MQLIRHLPLVLYISSLFLPAAKSLTNEYLSGMDLAFQGFLALLLLLPSLEAVNWDSFSPVLCWSGNFVFFSALFVFYRRPQASPIALAVVAALLMAVFLESPRAIYSDSGESYGPVTTQIGYFMWLAAPVSIILLSILRPKQKKNAA